MYNYCKKYIYVITNGMKCILDLCDVSQKEAPFEKNLARAVSIGPVTVAIEVVNAMYTYGQGVYDEKNCKNQVKYICNVYFRCVTSLEI